MNNKLLFTTILCVVFMTLNAQNATNKITLSAGGGIFLLNNNATLNLSAEYQLFKDKYFDVYGVLQGMINPKNRNLMDRLGVFAEDVPFADYGYSVSAGILGKTTIAHSRWAVSSGILLSNTQFWCAKYEWEHIPGVVSILGLSYEEVDQKFTPTIPVNVYFDLLQFDKFSIGLIGYFQWLVTHDTSNTGLNLYVNF